MLKTDISFFDTLYGVPPRQGALLARREHKESGAKAHVVDTYIVVDEHAMRTYTSFSTNGCVM